MGPELGPVNMDNRAEVDGVARGGSSVVCNSPPVRFNSRLIKCDPETDKVLPADGVGREADNAAAVAAAAADTVAAAAAGAVGVTPL